MLAMHLTSVVVLVIVEMDRRMKMKSCLFLIFSAILILGCGESITGIYSIPVAISDHNSWKTSDTLLLLSNNSNIMITDDNVLWAESVGGGQFRYSIPVGSEIKIKRIR